MSFYNSTTLPDLNRSPEHLRCISACGLAAHRLWLEATSVEEERGGTCRIGDSASTATGTVSPAKVQNHHHHVQSAIFTTIKPSTDYTVFYTANSLTKNYRLARLFSRCWFFLCTGLKLYSHSIASTSPNPPPQTVLSKSHNRFHHSSSAELKAIRPPPILYTSKSIRSSKTVP